MQQLKQLFQERLSRYYFFGSNLLIGLVPVAIITLVIPMMYYTSTSNQLSFEQMRLAAIQSTLPIMLIFSPLVVRRLHDLNLDGKFFIFIIIFVLFGQIIIDPKNNLILFLIFILIYWSILLILFVKSGTKGPNKYGPEIIKGTKFMDAILNRQKVQNN